MMAKQAETCCVIKQLYTIEEIVLHVVSLTEPLLHMNLTQHDAPV
jgi:hypothetical protein